MTAMIPGLRVGFGSIEDLRQRILGNEDDASKDRELMINGKCAASSIEYYLGMKFSGDIPIDIKLAWLIQCESMGVDIPRGFWLSQGCREWLEGFIDQNNIVDAESEFEPYFDPMIWLEQVEQSDELPNMISIELSR
jgi:hypothetical protein